MKIKFFSIFACLLSMLYVTSCDSNESTNDAAGAQTSKVCAYGVAKSRSESSVNSDLVFSEDNIAWFNPITKEIKFKEIEPSVTVFPVYTEIEFRIGSKKLFIASSFVTSLNSQIFDNLVIFYNVETSKYYLDDCYPNTPEMRNKEIVKKRISEREANWQEFLSRLKKDNKIK